MIPMDLRRYVAADGREPFTDGHDFKRRQA